MGTTAGERETRRSPLAAACERRAAEWPDSGAETGPLSFGDPEAEYGALRSGCAWLARPWVAELIVSGADRRRFINGLVTCAVKEMTEGDGTYGFFTSAQGRVLADVVVRSVGETLRLEVPSGVLGAVVEHAQKYVITDRVEFVRSDAAALTVAGPAAAACLSRALGGSVDLERWNAAASEAEGDEVLVCREERLGVPAWTVWTGSERAIEAVEAAGAVPAGFAAAERLRIEAGIPWFGWEFGPDNFPQETGLDEALNYEKGCYLGQEVVARIHYRGKVNHAVRGLRFEAEEPPPRGTALVLDGRPVGGVGGAVSTPTLGVIGLAMLHERALAPGTVVERDTGTRARVTELPFVKSQKEGS